MVLAAEPCAAYMIRLLLSWSLIWEPNFFFPHCSHGAQTFVLVRICCQNLNVKLHLLLTGIVEGISKSLLPNRSNACKWVRQEAMVNILWWVGCCRWSTRRAFLSCKQIRRGRLYFPYCLHAILFATHSCDVAFSLLLFLRLAEYLKFNTHKQREFHGHEEQRVH